MAQPFEVDGYRLIRHLGRGGTADVALASADQFNHEVAIKYPHSDINDPGIDFHQLAAREFHLIGKCRFPGLVKLLAEPHSDPDFLLMELCSGPTLDQVGRVDNLAVAMNLISAVALDLEFLRARGIIHGDLKPQNIFLSADWQTSALSPLFYAKISDFSLGRFQDEPEESRAGLGTVGYMPPETIRDGRTSFQSDLFALGMIAYQILTGQHPFSEGETDPAIINSKIQEEDPVQIESHRSDLPPELVRLVLQLLNTDPAKRPQSGLEVCRELANAGATYAFQRALHPKYFIDLTDDYDPTVERYLDISNHSHDRLSRITCHSASGLRMVLTANHARSGLTYTESGFSFTGGPYWPARMRRAMVGEYSRLPMAMKKAIIRAAVVGDANEAVRLKIVDAGDLPNHPDPIIDLLRAMLSAPTIRRLSARFGPLAEKTEIHGVATNLYIQAGMLLEAERCTLQHATALIKDNANDEALRYIRNVVDFALLVGNGFAIRELLMVRGDLYKSLGESDRALQTYEEIITLYEGHKPDKLLAETYKDLGDVYKLMEDVQQGIESLDKALKIFTDLGDELEISHTLNNIANMHFVSGNIRKALTTYRQALSIQRKLGAKEYAASTLMNIGVAYYAQGRYHRCITVTSLTLKINKEIGKLREISRSLNNLGYVYHLIGKSARAVDMLTESLEINRKLGSKKDLLYNLENLVEIMIAAGQLRKAMPYLREGMELGESIKDKHHSGAFRIITGIVYMRTGKFSDARSMLTQAREIVQDLDNQQLMQYSRLQEAYIRYLFGDRTVALERTMELLAGARDAQDIKTQVGALLLIQRLEDNAGYTQMLTKMIEDQHLEHEKLLMRFARIEFLLEQDRIEEASRLIGDPELLLRNLPDSIESPWMCNLAAEVLLRQQRMEEATPLLQRSLVMAKESGLKAEWAVALTSLGQVATHNGDYERSYALYREALGLWKAIAGSIDDENDRLTFMKQRPIVKLTEEIRRLSSVFAKKKGQTKACPSHEV